MLSMMFLNIVVGVISGVLSGIIVSKITKAS